MSAEQMSELSSNASMSMLSDIRYGDRNACTLMTMVAPVVQTATPFQVWSAAKGAKIDIWPVLAYVEGDTPFLCKLACTVGHSAARACHRCCLVGASIAGAVRYAAGLMLH